MREINSYLSLNFVGSINEIESRYFKKNHHQQIKFKEQIPFAFFSIMKKEKKIFINFCGVCGKLIHI